MVDFQMSTTAKKISQVAIFHQSSHASTMVAFVKDVRAWQNRSPSIIGQERFQHRMAIIHSLVQDSDNDRIIVDISYNIVQNQVCPLTLFLIICQQGIGTVVASDGFYIIQREWYIIECLLGRVYKKNGNVLKLQASLLSKADTQLVQNTHRFFNILIIHHIKPYLKTAFLLWL